MPGSPGRPVVIVGIGVDIVDLARFRAMLERTPTVRARIFTPAEAEGDVDSLAATFAAKEAVAKALGAPAGLGWHDVEVAHESSGRPRLDVRDTVAAAATAAGIAHWHLSLSHDAGTAVAMVVAESAR